MKFRCCNILLILSFAVLDGGCGGGASSTGRTSTVSGTNDATPVLSHVFIVVEENHSYQDVIGSSSMPYFNGLATAHGLATQFYGNAHPSLPNYFELTAGDATSITGVAGDSYAGDP